MSTPTPTPTAPDAPDAPDDALRLRVSELDLRSAELASARRAIESAMSALVSA